MNIAQIMISTWNINFSQSIGGDDPGKTEPAVAGPFFGFVGRSAETTVRREHRKRKFQVDNIIFIFR
jgi:hypothetical protein